MGAVQQNRHEIVRLVNEKGLSVAGEVASLLRGRPGLSRDEQVGNFEQVASLLKGQGVKPARRLAKETAALVAGRSDAEVNKSFSTPVAEETETEEGTNSTDALIDAAYGIAEAFEKFADSLSEYLDEQ